jgi:hypothetical protein
MERRGRRCLVTTAIHATGREMVATAAPGLLARFVRQRERELPSNACPLRTTRERAVRARADDRQPRAKASASPAAAVERLVIVLSVPERTPPPPRRPSGHARLVRGRRAADARRHVIRLLDIGVLPEAPMVLLKQQPTPRRARRDDLIALPSTWVAARIAGRTG